MSGKNDTDVSPEAATAISAAARCAELSLPFAAVSFAGDANWHFFAGDTGSAPAADGVERFVVSDFGNKHLITIGQRYSADDVLAMPQGSHAATTADDTADTATDYALYRRQVQSITAELARTKGKTVIARVIPIATEKPLGKILTDFFALLPHTTRFVFGTAHTGLWLGASPELLVDYSKQTHKGVAMSLAGTRRAGREGAGWDVKNAEEQNYVTRAITGVLGSMGLSHTVEESAPVRYGDIEHKCTTIHFSGRADALALAKALSPTPAVCGTPTAQAQRMILETERCPRQCYGGWIGIDSPTRLRTYVTLRCARAIKTVADRSVYHIYTGSGLTSRSLPADEWLETQRKSAPLRKALTTNDNC